jgi:hypothetical protein
MLRSPEHRERRGHPAGRRIGEDGHEGNPLRVEARQRRRDLRHLHERQRAFLHARAPRAGDDDERARASCARSAARVTFSPTTLPIEPPMKPYSMTAMMTGRRREASLEITRP